STSTLGPQIRCLPAVRTMAESASQTPRLAFGGESLPPRKIRRQIGNLLVGKWLGHGAHDRVGAVSVAMPRQREHEIAILLTGEARRFRRDRLVAFGTVACRASLVCLLFPG